MSTRPARPLEWLQQLPPPSKELPVKQWAVLVRLALAMHADGSGWVPVERLARELDAGVATVKRATAWARSAKLLEQTSRGHRISAERRAASTYQLLLPTAHSSEPLGDWDSVPTAQNGEPTAQNGEPTAHSSEPLRAPLQEPPYQEPRFDPPAPIQGSPLARQNADSSSATQEPKAEGDPTDEWHEIRKNTAPKRRTA